MPRSQRFSRGWAANTVWLYAAFALANVFLLRRQLLTRHTAYAELPDTSRVCVRQHGSVFGPRILELSMAPVHSAPLTNFRDFGGRESMHGGRLQRGLLFRCGQLHDLTPEQHNYLTRMNFDLVVDLRRGRERIRHPMPWPVDPVRKLFTIDDDGMDGAPHKELLRKGPITSADVSAFYHNFYRRLPFDTAYRDLFTRSMIALSATQGRVLIYCTAGKDRTGMMVALVQHVLGVHQADVHSDYLRSRV